MNTDRKFQLIVVAIIIAVVAAVITPILIGINSKDSATEVAERYGFTENTWYEFDAIGESLHQGQETLTFSVRIDDKMVLLEAEPDRLEFVIDDANPPAVSLVFKGGGITASVVPERNTLREAISIVSKRLIIRLDAEMYENLQVLLKS